MKQASEEQKRLAKKAGKLPKPPKKPKRGASLATLERYKARHADYLKKVADMAKRATKKQQLQKEIFGSY